MPRSEPSALASFQIRPGLIIDLIGAKRQSCRDLRSTMKKYSTLAAISGFVTATPSVVAADASQPSWHAQSLGQAMVYMLIFAALGIFAAIVGYKLFDKCTPGNLNKEILENKNVAAAIVAAAVIIGVCIIIAAAMLG